MTSTGPDAPAGGADQNAVAAPPRALKFAVIAMGVILIVGFAAVFITIGYRVANPERPVDALVGDAAGSAAAPAAFGTVSLDAPAGARVVGTALDGTRALITVRAGSGPDTVIVVDLATGAEIGRIAVGAE